MANIVWEEIAKQAAELSPTEKAHLIAWLSASLSEELAEVQRRELDQGDQQVKDSATWTQDELSQLMNLKPMTPAELIAWLDANPPTESWGDLRDDEDAADYIHRKRRQTWSTPDDSHLGD